MFEIFYEYFMVSLFIFRLYSFGQRLSPTLTTNYKNYTLHQINSPF
jgi:hypothetical protein